jgi:hypothetical protein
MQVWQFEIEQAMQEMFPLGTSRKKLDLHVVQMGPFAHTWQLGKLQSTHIGKVPVDRSEAGSVESKT